jgi:large subunit ribosomal protein L23
MALFDRFTRKKEMKKDREAAEQVQRERTAPPKKEAAKEQAAPGRTAAGTGYAKIILKPHVSEKSAMLADKGVYVFDVPRSANKVEIAKAVHALYKVDVASVRTIRMKGKVMGRGRRIQGRRKDWKKALVQLERGQTIALVEGV